MSHEALSPQRGDCPGCRSFKKKSDGVTATAAANTSPTDTLPANPAAVHNGSSSSNPTPVSTPPKVKLEQAIPNTLSTPKISLKNIAVPKVEEKPKEEVPDQIAVNKETCLAIWNDFAALLKQKGNTNAYTVFTHTQPQSLENGWLHVGYTNPLQESILTEMKWELQEFFSSRLNGQKIGFKPVLIQEEESSNKKILYTDEDKLRYLSEKHPAVDELKKRMGLDPNV